MNDGPSETPVPVVVKKVLKEKSSNFLARNLKKKNSISLSAKKDAAPPMTKTSSSMKRAEEDRPKGVDMAPSQWLENIVHENQKYYGRF